MSCLYDYINKEKRRLHTNETFRVKLIVLPKLYMMSKFIKLFSSNYQSRLVKVVCI